MKRQSSFGFVVLIALHVWFLESTNAITTGPLTDGGFLVSSIPDSLEQNSPINVTVRAMTAEWTTNTTFSNIAVNIETVYGTPVIQFADTFDNSGITYNFLFSSGETTNMSKDCTVAAKGSNCSAKLTGGIRSHRRDYKFGTDNQVQRYSAYMRTCCATENGPYVGLLQENSTGTFLVVSAYFDGTGVIRMRRTDAAGNIFYSSGYAYELNTWYRVDVVIDWTARTSDLYVNGIFVTGSFPLYPSVNTASGINMYNYDSTTSWVDEIEVVAQEGSVVAITSLISPYPAILQNGIWNGTVTVQQQSNNATIKASYQIASPKFYLEGSSNSFTVVSPSPSPSPSPSKSPSPSPSLSPSPSPSPSPSLSASQTPSRTPSVTASPTRSPSPSSSPSTSATPSPSPSLSNTPSVTPSFVSSSSPSPSASPSTIPTTSPSATPSSSPSISPSSSSSSSPSISPSGSPSSSCSSSSSVSSGVQPVSPSASPAEGNKTKKSSNTTAIVASTVSIAGVVCVGVAVAVVFVRRRRPRDGRMRSESVELPLKPHYMPGRANSQDRLEIDYKDISIGPEIGRGAFGSVYKARWRNCDCVVKQLNVDNKEIAIKEAQTTRALRPHKNVCTMFGICTNPAYPVCIVMEFVEGGTLKDLVYSPLKVELDALMAIGFAKDVVSGMTHIHRENILHCDLACRNLLVQKSDRGYTVKVTDFGLARVSESGLYDAKEEAKFPIRWSAPEVLTERKVSRASDVWSFGIVLWEILEGKMPYYDLLNNSEVIEVVCNQHKPPSRPTKRFPYPDDLYDVVMMACWREDPLNRPTFDELFAILDELELTYGKKEQIEELPPSLESSQHLYTSYQSNANQNPDHDNMYGNQNLKK